MNPNQERYLTIAKGLLEQPTAATREQLPQAYIRNFVNERPPLHLTEDPSGNLLVKYSDGASEQSSLVLVAHLDHPGFWVENVDGKICSLSFQGSVLSQHVRAGARVRFFEAGSIEPVGKGALIEIQQMNGRLTAASASILEGVAVAGGIAMWDFPGFTLEEGLIVSRACDDPLGAAAALCTLDTIVSESAKNINLWCLFTRAEEIGLMGALEAIRHKIIPKKAAVLSLECSKALANAPQGDGVIVRVGDWSSIFDPGLTDALRHAAEAVKKSDPSFKYQVKLMDGGTCEATAFCAHGYRASGVAVPLGNYHNQAVERDGTLSIGAESVKVADFIHEVQLLVELARRPELLKKRSLKNSAWLKARSKTARELLGKN